MFTKIVEQCRIDFKPAKSSIDLPQQQELFSAYSNDSHIKMGIFYELFTSCLIGGRLVDSVLRSYGKGREGPMPDIMSRRGNFMIESKACRMGHQLNLLDGQISLYRKYQIIQPQSKIMYAIWRHRLYGIRKYRKGEVALFKELAIQTVAGIIVPFSIILHLHGMGEDFRHYIREKHDLCIKRYETDTWDHCTRVSSKVWNGFVLKPRETISAVGLDADAFLWERYMTPVIKINGVGIKSVPFIFIIDRDHNKAITDSLETVPF